MLCGDNQSAAGGGEGNIGGSDCRLKPTSQDQETNVDCHKFITFISRGRAVVARQAHNLKVVSSNLTHRNQYWGVAQLVRANDC